ncbi:hypothetical protein V6N11_057058 [Hibiscus sabdariffa]|uniref:Uncharacterized protein n=1 Tax=Hibiscus sabdariffa TaxID=183260 RepID=A0ABR1ZI89_9ROSI
MCIQCGSSFVWTERNNESPVPHPVSLNAWSWILASIKFGSAKAMVKFGNNVTMIRPLFMVASTVAIHASSYFKYLVSNSAILATTGFPSTPW